VIVLDASVVIAQLDDTDVHHARAVELLIETADESLLISPLTLAECFVGPARTGRLDQARSAVELLEIAVVPLTESDPARLAGLRVQTALQMPDCCVLLAAETSAAELATFDRGLGQAAQSLGLVVRS
jgi:predicted nucleic acid-binding protein